MADYDYDLFTIGAGSGGVRASRVAAAHGARVAVAEEYRVGGTCVIRGCVPKKMLVYGSQFAEDIHDAQAFGWKVEDPSFDWTVLRDNVLKDVDRLNGLYTQTLENHGVEIIPQRATVSGPHEVTLADGTKKTARYILVCTGARPHIPGCPGYELGITSNEAFHLEAVPKRILISGAGYIANEFAGIFNEFGARVTLINRSDQLLRGYDESMRDRLLQISVTKGIEFRFNANFQGIRKNDDVETRLMSQESAIEAGALALFGEKYGDEVRVVSMGGRNEEEAKNFSTELCGGTHVRRTGDIGLFKIISEGAVASGVRRIEAMTGAAAEAYIAEQQRLLGEAAAALKTLPADLAHRIVALVDEKKKLERDLTEARKVMALAGSGSAGAAQVGGTKDIGGIALASRVLSGVPAKELKAMADELKKQIGSGVVVLISDDAGKASLVVGVTADLTGKLSAVDLVKAGSSALGGQGGGGRPDMAQAGGPDAGKAADALAAIERALGGTAQAA